MILSLLFLFLVGVHSETVTPYLSFLGENLSNHSYVNFTQVTWFNNVQCHSKLEGCCGRTEEGPRGDWFFPNGSMLKTYHLYYAFQTHRVQRVDLIRFIWTTWPQPPVGIYHCDIAVTTDKPSVHQSLYVGLYTIGGSHFLHAYSLRLLLSFSPIHQNSFCYRSCNDSWWCYIDSGL